MVQNWKQSIEATYKNDTLIGKRKIWYETQWREEDKPKLLENYENGKLQGKVTEYYQSGTVKRETTYQNGQIVGEQITFYEKSGKIRASVPYQNNQKHGLATQFYEDGTKKAENNFIANRREGSSKRWYKNGQLEWEGNFTNDTENGVFKAYKPNGVLRTTVTYKNGQQIGGDQTSEKIDTKTDETE